MGVVIRIALWFFKGLLVMLPFGAILWGVGHYTSLGPSIQNLVHMVGNVFPAMIEASTIASNAVASFFDQILQSVSSYSLFNFFSYCLSLDVFADYISRLSSVIIHVLVIGLGGSLVVLITVTLVYFAIRIARSVVKGLSFLGATRGG